LGIIDRGVLRNFFLLKQDMIQQFLTVGALVDLNWPSKYSLDAGAQRVSNR
jgi:hypothetical protein